MGFKKSYINNRVGQEKSYVCLQGGWVGQRKAKNMRTRFFPIWPWLGIRPGPFPYHVLREEGVLQTRQPLGLEAEPRTSGPTHNWI